MVESLGPEYITNILRFTWIYFENKSTIDKVYVDENRQIPMGVTCSIRG